MEQEVIFEQVCTIIQQVTERQNIDRDTDLIIGKGKVSFINMLKIMLGIEKEFGIILSEEDLRDQSFYTINGMGETIYKRIGG